MPIATINPATGETVKTFDEMSEEDVEQLPGRRRGGVTPATG